MLSIWAIDFAVLQPLQESVEKIPAVCSPNGILQIWPSKSAMAQEDWMFYTKFDYIHDQILSVCFTDMKEVFRSIFNALRPGGRV